MYFDNAATTEINSEVYRTIINSFQDFYNPSSLYHPAINNHQKIIKAKTEISQYLKCKPNELTFTSCCSESNNWVIKCIPEYYNMNFNKNHIITSCVEHKSILNACKHMESIGYQVTYLPVNNEGRINIDDLEDAITDKTCLVSIMSVNNEINAFNPIKSIGEICHKNNILFHTDATQAIDCITPSFINYVDLLSCSGHKIGTPKGIGLLYKQSSIKIPCLIDGGGQEDHLRSGTENIHYILGLAKAFEILKKTRFDKIKHITNLNAYIKDGIIKNIPDVIINGSAFFYDNSLKFPIYKILNVSFKDINGEALLLKLSEKGIYISNGSACNSGNLEPSYVLSAIKIPQDYIYGTIRISPSANNTYEDCDILVQNLQQIISEMRNTK